MRPNYCEFCSLPFWQDVAFSDIVISVPNCDSFSEASFTFFECSLLINIVQHLQRESRDVRNKGSTKERKTQWLFKGEFERPSTGIPQFWCLYNLYAITSCSFQNEAYWNVMVFCCDGTLALNRLSVGLIFPQLQDEISVICPVRPNSIWKLLLDTSRGLYSSLFREKPP